ncbi:MAG TPA: ABC transporter permease [Candidatus Paceibacterota bacterium]|nr:ABC transporter permease [Verrucomicrobiota bacterium]HRY48138.1 ABC transporter permease [Candidatus Paceibacterota bacterium]HRZ57123.1 ABC transporter permease [Candidatus Paceibacterota bacterium]
MKILRTNWSKIRSLWQRPGAKRETNEELRFHLEQRTQQNIAAGMAPEDTACEARKGFGNLQRIREECRDTRGASLGEGTLSDVRFAFRQLRKSPGFTLVTVVTLALGIGANTAIFSVVDSVVLRPLPYPRPDQLVWVWGHFAGIGLPDNQNAISAPELRDLETQNRCFSHVAGLSTGGSFNLKFGDDPQRIEGSFVTPAFFPLLGVQPALGRAFLPTDADPGQNQVVVLSHSLWRRGFGADPGVVGRRLNINGLSHEVVGVMPAGFESFGAELWAPLGFTPENLIRREQHGLQVLARIKPDLTFEQAQADMSALTRAVKDQNPGYPYERFQFAFRLTPLHDALVGSVRKPLWILAGAVTLVLLIACANVANLLLVRSSARQREVAIRLALGASRGRLFRQWITESVLLSALGGLAGLAVAQAGLKLLVQLGATIFPHVAEATLDGRVLTFTMLVSLATGILFGLAPGLRTAREVKTHALRGDDRNATSGPIVQRLRHALIVAEIALALVILSGAGLLLRSLIHVWAVDSGFRPDNVLTMRVSLPAAKYAESHQVRAFYDEVLARISRLPGVEAAGATGVLPLSGGGSSGTVIMDATAVPPDRASPEADLCVVTPGYFQAMGIPVQTGRAFESHDTDRSQPVVVVDETLARTYWPGEDAVGKRLRPPGMDAPWATIIGVVRHVRSRTLEAPSRIQVYWPESQATSRSLTLAIRTRTAPRNLITAVRREIAAVAPDQPVFNVRTMVEWTQDSLALRRLGTHLLSAFAGVALVLAVVGIYAVMAYWVGQRTREIGLRAALGARQRDLLRLVMGQGLRLAVVGIALGLVGALALTGILSTQLFGVGSTDPITFAGVSLTLLSTTMLACYLPARHAARVDPMLALRRD